MSIFLVSEAFACRLQRYETERDREKTVCLLTVQNPGETRDCSIDKNKWACCLDVPVREGMRRYT
jgi:hypothetical protein